MANDTAQQPRGRWELWVTKSLNAPAVCCSAGFGAITSLVRAVADHKRDAHQEQAGDR